MFKRLILPQCSILVLALRAKTLVVLQSAFCIAKKITGHL